MCNDLDYFVCPSMKLFYMYFIYDCEKFNVRSANLTFLLTENLGIDFILPDTTNLLDRLHSATVY